MQFYDVIQSRTSIRKFKNTHINEEKLSRMINAAMMSPTWKNNTSYRFIIVDDVDKKNKLATAIINDTNDAANSVREAPLVTVVVANPNLSGEVAEREYYLVDSAIALEHFVLAATAEGYGTCWIASINEDDIRNILNIPKDFRVVAITPVGEIAEHKEKSTVNNAKDLVFLNSWEHSYKEKNLVMH